VPWVRFDDQYPIDRKIVRLSDPAFRLVTEAIFWCARNLTDGYIPEEDLAEIRPRLESPEKYAAEAVNRQLWHMPSELCPYEKCPAPVTEGPGWVIHNYWQYQPSKAQVHRDREAKAARQARWLGKARRKLRDASQDASAGPSQDASIDSTPPRTVGAGPYGPAPTAPAARSRSPNGQRAAGVKPPWCGTCNPDTRQLGDPPRRCPDCHPLRPIVDDPWATP